MARRDFGADAVNKASSGWLDDLDSVIQRGLSVTPQDFGAVGDGVTDDSAAFVAALAYLNNNSQLAGGYSRGASELFIPKGYYYLGTTSLDITSTMRIRGEGVGNFSGWPTVLKWGSGTTGIRVQRYNTSGDSTVDGVIHSAGDSSIIEGLALWGAYAGTEAEAHAFHLKARATFRDCVVYNFQGDGIHIEATAGGSPEGNANGFVIEDVLVTDCRNGYYSRGADANSGRTVGLKCYSNRRWGIYERAFLGNTHVAPETGDNGIVPAPVQTLVSYNGFRYCVVDDQETGAATNPPTGAATDNTWWIYHSVGGPHAVVPDWTNGITVRSGGGYYGASNSVFIRPYSEGGEGIAQFNEYCIVNNMIGGRRSGLPGDIGVSSDGLTFGGNARVAGNIMVGPITGAAAGLQSNNFSGNNYFDITATCWNASVASSCSLIRSYYSGDVMCQAFGTQWQFVVGGQLTFVTTANAIELQSGKVLKVNGTQVVGAQGAAVAADATDLATALTLVNQLKARMRTHGLIA